MLIGISGKIGSGKDTFANMLVAKRPSYEKKAFAHKLKVITSLLTGSSLEDNYSQEGKNMHVLEWDMTLGEMQQKLGTTCIRNNLNRDAWVIALFVDWHPLCDWVITDVRFPNEAEAVRKRNGLLVRINGDPASVRANSKRDLTHASEISLDTWTDWDLVIKNSSPLENMEKAVDSFLSNPNWKDRI